MRPVGGAGPRRRKGEARRGITRLAGSERPKAGETAPRSSDLALKRRGALQGPHQSRPLAACTKEVAPPTTAE
jgi:hypothetical protein